MYLSSFRQLRLYFNPRSHEGNDSPWDSTCDSTCYFNPRSHEGNDHYRLEVLTYDLYFNPRSHEGNDVTAQEAFKEENYFNPRSHEGNDDCMRDILFYLEISIHVPTRGTTEENTMMSRTY